MTTINFRKAGADVLFVELKTSATILDDMKRITSSVDGPCLVNIDGGGKLDRRRIVAHVAGGAFRPRLQDQ